MFYLSWIFLLCYDYGFSFRTTFKNLCACFSSMVLLNDSGGLRSAKLNGVARGNAPNGAPATITGAPTSHSNAKYDADLEHLKACFKTFNRIESTI